MANRVDRIRSDASLRIIPSSYEFISLVGCFYSCERLAETILALLIAPAFCRTRQLLQRDSGITNSSLKGRFTIVASHWTSNPHKGFRANLTHFQAESVDKSRGRCYT